nr:MAG TPA: hypothetical protein [Caudoviricetes sp.]
MVPRLLVGFGFFPRRPGRRFRAYDPLLVVTESPRTKVLTGSIHLLCAYIFILTKCYYPSESWRCLP